MYYLQSRYYDPNTCRFINADSYIAMGQGLTGYNMFAYCGNNPVTRIDPTGKLFEYNINFEDDFYLEGAGSGGFGASDNYSGYGTAYYNYSVNSSVASYNAGLCGYYFGGGSYIGGSTAQYAIGTVSVNDSMAISGESKIKSCTNGYEINEYYDRSLSPKGTANSISNLYFEGELKQQRIYGPNGKAILDIDYFHSGNNHTFPHIHIYNWTLDKPRGEAINLFSYN